jgi:hypothetical protein
MKITTQKLLALEIEADRMEPKTHLIFSKYLQFFVSLPSQYSSLLQPNDKPKWYQSENKKPIKVVNPKIENSFEKNGKMYFKYFVRIHQPHQFSCTKHQTRKLEFLIYQERMK